MKFLSCALLFVVILLVSAEDVKRCRSQDDCSEDECCVARSLFGVRRGDCKKLGQLNSSCSPKDELIIFNNQYALECPCVDGLSCEPTQEKHFFFGTLKYDERCVESTATTVPTTSED